MGLQVVVNFQVIDESDDWLVVDKPAPLIVHPANRKQEPSLLGGVEKLLAFEVENGRRPAVVNRLDRDTSGVVLVAKHTAAARELGLLFDRREVHKEYLAIVIGWPEANEWECAEPILRAAEVAPSPIWVRQITHKDGRESLTRFVVESRFERCEGRFSLIRCFPATGRMHQIRVHLACGGYPIAGDKIYSGDGDEYLEWMADGWTPSLAGKLLLPRHALHAAALELKWRGIPMRWVAPLPPDLVAFMRGESVSATPDVVIWSRAD